MNPKGGNPKTLKNIICEFNLDETKLNENRHKLFSKCGGDTSKKNQYPLEDILNGKYPNYNSGRLLKRLVEEGYKEKRCERCGIVDWMGQEITFHLHHKDGNHNNNLLENLQSLCPNCHSQTDSFAGKSSKKNIKESKPKVSKEVLLKIMEENTYKSAAELLGVNSKTVSRWYKYYINENDL